MQFAYTPRKSSTAGPSAMRTSTGVPSSFITRRLNALRPILLAVAGIISCLWLLARLTSGKESGSFNTRDTPKAVIVTVFDVGITKTQREAIEWNRKDYASRHGYITFFTNSTAYDHYSKDPVRSWTALPSLRHAMTLYPHTPFLFYLSPTALIMNPSLSIQNHIMNPRRLETLIKSNQPIIPPDSVIKTFPHIKPENIDFVLSQDDKGLGHNSMIIRTGDWARYFLDAWFDPLYRSYNFQKAERHALEHIVQWHGTILVRLGIVPQNIMNSYVRAEGPKDVIYTEGDFIANFFECDRRPVAQKIVDEIEADREEKEEDIIIEDEEDEEDLDTDAKNVKRDVEKEDGLDNVNSNDKSSKSKPKGKDTVDDGDGKGSTKNIKDKKVVKHKSKNNQRKSKQKTAKDKDVEKKVKVTMTTDECEKEMQPLLRIWRDMLEKEGRLEHASFDSV